MIDKTYQPSEVEGRIYKTWEAAGAFRAGRPERAGAPPYSIVIPPPNVTGSLHMGHALNNTLQDVLCRFERMRGRDVLWPGTDIRIELNGTDGTVIMTGEKMTTWRFKDDRPEDATIRNYGSQAQATGAG